MELNWKKCLRSIDKRSWRKTVYLEAGRSRGSPLLRRLSATQFNDVVPRARRMLAPSLPGRKVHGGAWRETDIPLMKVAMVTRTIEEYGIFHGFPRRASNRVSVHPRIPSVPTPATRDTSGPNGTYPRPSQSSHLVRLHPRPPASSSYIRTSRISMRRGAGSARDEHVARSLIYIRVGATMHVYGTRCRCTEL